MSFAQAPGGEELKSRPGFGSIGYVWVRGSGLVGMPVGLQPAAKRGLESFSLDSRRK